MFNNLLIFWSIVSVVKVTVLFNTVSSPKMSMKILLRSMRTCVCEVQTVNTVQVGLFAYLL